MVKCCVICGTYAQCTDSPDPQHWWQHVRFIHFDLLPAGDHPLRNNSSPCITCPGKIWYNHTDEPNQPCPYLRITRLDGKSHDVLLPSRIFGCSYFSPIFSEVSACYPVHCFCWEMFTSVAGFRTDTYPEAKLKTLYQVLGSQKFNNDSVIWEHGYDYDDMVFPVDEGSGCNNPTKVPRPDYWLSGDETLRLRVRSIRPASIPNMMGPLPLELIHTVLSYTSLRDLMVLTRVRSATRYNVPNLVWKGFFDVRSDLGFLSSSAGMSPGGSWYRNLLTSSKNPNWYSLCLFGLKYAASGSPIVSNRRRIWKLCLRLSNLVDEIHDSVKWGFNNHVDYPFLGQFPVSDLKFTTFEMPKNNLYSNSGIPYIVQTIEPPDLERPTEDFEDMRAVSTRGCLGPMLVDEIGVTFTGEGKLRYVTGLSFLWGSKLVGAVGLVSRQRMRRVLLDRQFEEFNMAIAVNQYGIVDILIVPGSCYWAGREQKWLGGGMNMDGAAVMRRNFILPPKFESSGLSVAAVVVDSEVYKIKRFGIFSPQLVVLGLRESLACHNLWQPRPPIVSFGQSLNLTRYCGVLDHTVELTKSGCIRFDLRFFHDKVKAGPVKPFSYINFEDELPDRFTCWVGSQHLFVGLSFSIIDEDGTVAKKWAFGSEYGVPIDFPLNPERKERVRYIELALCSWSMSDIAIYGIREVPTISRITVYTTCRRRFHLVLGLSQNPNTLLYTLMPEMENHKITGLYGRSGWMPSPGRRGIIGLGIISRADTALQSPIPPSDIRGMKRAVAAENAQFSPMIEAPDSHHNEPKDILSEMFVSHVDLTDCMSIIVYINIQPKENEYTRHITGLSVKFYGKKDKELSGNPRYLGRISAGDHCETIELDVSKGEMLEKIIVCREKIAEREFAILAMEFRTTLKRRIGIGNLDCKGGEVKAWNLGCNDIVWAFNQKLEWIRGFASKEEWLEFCNRLGSYGIVLA